MTCFLSNKQRGCFFTAPFVKILTGIRRCGKSTILKMIMEKLRTERNIPENQIVSYRFDSMEYEDMTAQYTEQAIEQNTTKA